MPPGVLADTLGISRSIVCNWDKGAKAISPMHWAAIERAIAEYVPPGPEVWFWPKVDIRGPDECWPWKRSTQRYGYGGVTRNKEKKTASRVAWELTYGPIPADKPFICHHCDHPWCCNPAHLFPGTHLDNMADMRRKGRSPKNDNHQGEDNGNAKLTEQKVRQIRERYVQGDVTQTQLAQEFGVSSPLVSMIINRRVWQHIE